MPYNPPPIYVVRTTFGEVCNRALLFHEGMHLSKLDDNHASPVTNGIVDRNMRIEIPEDTEVWWFGPAATLSDYDALSQAYQKNKLALDSRLSDLKSIHLIEDYHITDKAVLIQLKDEAGVNMDKEFPLNNYERFDRMWVDIQSLVKAVRDAHIQGKNKVRKREKETPLLSPFFDSLV